MEELINRLEEKIKEQFQKKGFGWLIWVVTIGFIILNSILSILFKEKPKIEPKERKMNEVKVDIKKQEVKREFKKKEKDIKYKPNITLTPLLKEKKFAWSLFGISFILMFIENFLNMDKYVGGWHIVLYILILTPLFYLAFTNQLKNPHTKWFFIPLLVMIFDMFYYNNNFVQLIVPIFFFVMVWSLYITSMHNLHSLYQTLMPKLSWGFDIIDNMIAFLSNLFIRESHKKIYGRIALALLITIPFLGVFIALLFSADSNFSSFIEKILSFNIDFDSKYILTVPLYFFLYLTFFLYSFSIKKDRSQRENTPSLDILIVGIFLGMINILFITFISLQMPFLFGGEYLTKGLTIAEFAREGFFQLMMVMGIVLLIFLFIMRRFKGEKTITIMLSGLLIETILMGVVSLKKMYLYQDLKGATVMRYYVEWFDYFLLIVLLLGIWFIIRKLEFSKLLNTTTILAVLAFSTIISLNVDEMVASHNIVKFKDNQSLLDKNALKNLSIDALPVISKYNIILDNNRSNMDWYRIYKRKECDSFSEYHIGYCSILKNYD